MIGRARTAVKFFVYGLVGGLLFAPQSGTETRKQVMTWVSGTVQETMKNISGGSGGGGSNSGSESSTSSTSTTSTM
ncbi:MAG TPA: YtxH domain-containing protein [Thermomicrobiales bacterium]|nr:YtxH domain-containing protein [Thermomicrobiales bacterium]